MRYDEYGHMMSASTNNKYFIVDVLLKYEYFRKH